MTRLRISKQWGAALGMLFWLPLLAGAHVGDRLYPVFELTDEMLAGIRIDGSIDEWIELLGEPAMTALDFRKTGEHAPPDPSTLDFWIWLAWHGEPARFYVAFVASDDVYENTHDYDVALGSGDGDSIELAIDGDHSGGRGAGQGGHSDEEWLELVGQTQGYYAAARTASGSTLDVGMLTYATEAGAWMAQPPYGEGGGSVAGETPVISVIELYVTPFDRLEGWYSPVEGWHSPVENAVSDLAAGQIIGFGILVSDHAPPHGSSVFLPEGLEHVDIVLQQADGFLDGILLSAAPEPEDSAIEAVFLGPNQSLPGVGIAAYRPSHRNLPSGRPSGP